MQRFEASQRELRFGRAKRCSVGGGGDSVEDVRALPNGRCSAKGPAMSVSIQG